MCSPNAAAHRRVSRVPEVHSLWAAPGEQDHPEQAQADGDDDAAGDPCPEEQAVGQRGEDDEEAGDHAAVRRRREEQPQRLEEVTGRERDAYPPADHQRPAREPRRRERRQSRRRERETGREKRQHPVQHDGVLYHDERPSPDRRDPDEQQGIDKVPSHQPLTSSGP